MGAWLEFKPKDLAKYSQCIASCNALHSSMLVGAWKSHFSCKDNGLMWNNLGHVTPEVDGLSITSLPSTLSMGFHGPLNCVLF